MQTPRGRGVGSAGLPVEASTGAVALSPALPSTSPHSSRPPSSPRGTSSLWQRPPMWDTPQQKSSDCPPHPRAPAHVHWLRGYCLVPPLADSQHAAIEPSHDSSGPPCCELDRQPEDKPLDVRPSNPYPRFTPRCWPRCMTPTETRSNDVSLAACSLFSTDASCSA